MKTPTIYSKSQINNILSELQFKGLRMPVPNSHEFTRLYYRVLYVLVSRIMDSTIEINDNGAYVIDIKDDAIARMYKDTSDSEDKEDVLRNIMVALNETNYVSQEEDKTVCRFLFEKVEATYSEQGEPDKLFFYLSEYFDDFICFRTNPRKA